MAFYSVSEPENAAEDLLPGLGELSLTKTSENTSEGVMRVSEDTLQNLKTSANTAPLELLRIWKKTGVYYHNCSQWMTNVFPPGSVAHDVVRVSNDRVTRGLGAQKIVLIGDEKYLLSMREVSAESVDKS